jgi:hypothetical protein
MEPAKSARGLLKSGLPQAQIAFSELAIASQTNNE